MLRCYSWSVGGTNHLDTFLEICPGVPHNPQLDLTAEQQQHFSFFCNHTRSLVDLWNPTINLHRLLLHVGLARADRKLPLHREDNES